MTDKELSISEVMVDEVASKLTKLASELPFIYKLEVMSPSIQLILAGLKAGTAIIFPRSSYVESDFNILKEVFERFGIRVSEHKDRTSEAGQEGHARHFWFYNPATLRSETLDSDLVPPYDGEMELEDYIQLSLEGGSDMHAIIGKILSYPESAIKEFVLARKHPTIRRILDMLNLEMAFQAPGESIVFYSPSIKLMKRAWQVKLFHELLNQNEEYKRLRENEEILLSRVEFRQKVFEMTA